MFKVEVLIEKVADITVAQIVSSGKQDMTPAEAKQLVKMFETQLSLKLGFKVGGAK